MSEPEQRYEFDVALSYAGEERSYVHGVANCLRKNGVRVFYDEFFTADLWGQNLYTYLDTVYRQKSRFTVVFISQSYVAKPWPSHERQSAQARSLNELGPYLLPVRFDDSVMPGLLPTVSYIDALKISPDQLGQLIIDKLSHAPGVTVAAPLMLGVPRTIDEQRQLLAQRPPAWEFLLYAGVLLRQRSEIEYKWRDNEIRYAGRHGQYINDDAGAVSYLSGEMSKAAAIVAGVNRVLASDAQETAFGLPGVPGNPERIEHLATRLIDVYEELLDWAAGVRGTTVSEQFSNVFEFAARLAEQPARQIRGFVDEFVASAEALPGQIDRGERVALNFVLTLSIDDKAQSDALNELDRLIRNMGQV